MAVYPIFLPGYYPSGFPDVCISNELLEQMHLEAQYVDGIGAIIWSPAAPDCVTYPKLAYFIWGLVEGGIRTGKLFYWTGTEYFPVGFAPNSLNGSALVDGSVLLSKLSVSGGAAGQLIRVNIAEDEFEFINADTLFGDNSIALSKLASAGGAGFIPYSDASGQFGYALYGSLFDAKLNVASFPVARLVDGDIVSPDNGVPYFVTAGGAAQIAQVKDLIEANTLLTSKLNLANFAGKILKVNAEGTDVVGVNANDLTNKLAIVRATAPAGTPPQVINAVGPTVVTLTDDATDPDNLVSLTGSVIRFLAAGTYEVDIDVPLFMASGDVRLQVILYNVTGTAIAAYRNSQIVSGGDVNNARLVALVTVAANADYDVRIECATVPSSLYLGREVNIGGRAEVYTQVKIRKLA